VEPKLEDDPIRHFRHNRLLESWSQNQINRGRNRERVYTTVISQYELLTPVYHKGIKVEERNIRAFLKRSVVLPLDQNAAEELSRIMVGLFKLGVPINALDTLIAGIAITTGTDKIATLDRDFTQIAKITELVIIII
jgi:predicted nucleic acid-binding protein